MDLGGRTTFRQEGETGTKRVVATRIRNIPRDRVGPEDGSEWVDTSDERSYDAQFIGRELGYDRRSAESPAREPPRLTETKQQSNYYLNLPGNP
jgi:hypothetical protein